jgi:hypothetical protein
MILDFHDSFRDKAEVKATRLLVCDNFNNPLALFVENEVSIITCYTAGDANFIKMLEEYGIKAPNIRKINLGG